MNLDLKSILKTIKLQEGNISMILGALVILVLAFLVLRYFKAQSTNQILSSGSTETRQTHKVAKGESLWKISEKYYANGMNWNKIAKANNITDANKLEIGQELVIPAVEAEKDVVQTKTPQTQKDNSPITGATYEIVKGDTLWAIAVRAYQDGYKWVNIAKENKLKNPNLIYPTNKLIIPR